MSPSALSPSEQQSAPTASFWTTRALPFGMGLVLVALLTLLAWGILHQRDAVGLARVHTTQVPAFELPLFSGGSVSSTDLHGKPAVINFWASWCVPCEVEAPVLEAAARKYGDRVAFLGINVQDTEPDALRFLERHGTSFPHARDGSGEVSIAFGMTGVPETYFVDRTGRIVRKWNGALTTESIERLVNDVLRER